MSAGVRQRAKLIPIQVHISGSLKLSRFSRFALRVLQLLARTSFSLRVGPALVGVLPVAPRGSARFVRLHRLLVLNLRVARLGFERSLLLGGERFPLGAESLANLADGII